MLPFYRLLMETSKNIALSGVNQAKIGVYCTLLITEMALAGVLRDTSTYSLAVFSYKVK